MDLKAGSPSVLKIIPSEIKYSQMIIAAAINFPTQNGKSRLFHRLGKDRFNGQLTYPMDLILKADPSISTGITSAWQGSIHQKN